MRHSWLLLAAALLAFGACLGGSFLLDDFALLSDPVVLSPGGWWQVWRPLQTRPLTYFSFWINYQLGGENPAGFHLVNLGLHLANTWLLSRVLRRYLPPAPAFWAALVFAVHPLQAQTVNYVFARSNLLMTLFCLLSWHAWSQGRLAVAAAWFVPALLAKEECVAFPLFLALLHLSVSRNHREWRWIGCMLLVALLAGARVWWVGNTIAGSGAGGQAGVTAPEYAAAQGLVLWRYLRQLLVPWGLTIDPAISVPSALLAAVAWLALAAAGVVATKRFARAREGFWWLGGLLLLLPSSSVFPAADLAADRRMYLPLAAFAGLAGLLLARAPVWVPRACIAGLILLSWQRTLVWRSPIDLWMEAVAAAPQKVRPKIQLARVSPPEKGLALLQEAQRIAPQEASVAGELGRLYLTTQQPAAALAEFGRALALRPQDGLALNNRGAALQALGQAAAAQQDFERALRVEPCLFPAIQNLRLMGVKAAPPPDCALTPAQRRALGED